MHEAHEMASPELRAEDVIVDFSALHMGMKDRNPMDLVRFYSKNARDSKHVLSAE